MNTTLKALPRGTRHAPDGRTFPWGPIQQVHQISGIQIVEYLADNSTIANPSEHTYSEHGQPRFHPYLDGRDMGMSFTTLDNALVGAIAYRREGPNSRAATYFNRMTGETDA